MNDFSFLLPTRERPDLIKRFFQSIVDTASTLENLELVLAVDEDDLVSREITHDTLKITKVVLPKGTTMGALNRACYDASKGRYVMLINDDVIVRTKNWDKIIYSIFAQFEDDIALIHTNDLLFQEKLCTFPILSRRACDAIGICPSVYKRYRIDDHIYDTYNMLAYLGHKRIVYLPDVTFEHDNFAHQVKDQEKQVFKATENKIYVPNQEIIELDAALFDQRLEERKQDALALAMLIEQTKTENVKSVYKSVLGGVRDSYSYRSSDFVTKVHQSEHSKGISSKGAPSITVGVVTSGIQKTHAKKCLSRIKKYTSDYDLVILDNNGGKGFNHPREMNKILRTAKTDYLVLMDDDVFVEEGWLEGLMKGFDHDKDAGVVTPMHKDKKGKLSYSGVYFMGNQYGMHAHLLDVPDQPREVQTLCSALMMIDMKRCGQIRVSEAYNKYFLDIDYGLRIWSSGYKVLCSPHTLVTHIGGATLSYSSIESQKLWNKDMRIFIEEWTKTNRFSEIKDNIWPEYSTVHLLSEIPRRIDALFEGGATWEFSRFKDEVDSLMVLSENYSLFMSVLVSGLEKCMLDCREKNDALKGDYCDEVLAKAAGVEFMPYGFVPILLGAYKSYNIVEFEDSIYALPQSLGVLNLYKEQDRKRPGIITGERREDVIDVIEGRSSSRTGGRDSDSSPTVSPDNGGGERPEESRGDIVVASNTPCILDTRKGYNIVSNEGYIYGLPLSIGHVDLTKQDERQHDDILMADSRRRLDAMIDELVSVPGEDHLCPAEPELVGESYNGFNLIRVDNKYFAIPQAEGVFDLERVRANQYSKVYVANSVEAVKEEIVKDSIPLYFKRLKSRFRKIMGR